MRERIEQRGFPGVGVAHQGDHAQRKRLARPATCGALAAHRFNGFLDFAHPVADAAPVRFQLLLSRAARSNSAAESGKLFTAAGKAGQQIIQLRQLHL